MPSNTPDSGRLQYAAFLSYSHAADGRLVEVIQSRLQRFATPWYRRRSIRVFRDTTGLGVTPDLWDAIRVALEASEYFILFASEQAAQSQWVGQEVDAFLSARSADRVLIAWTDGELCWDGAADDFDWTRTTCLPVRLRGVFHAEPLHLDLRWARAAKDLSPRRPEFLDAVARLSATLRQLPIDDLVGEDVKQHRRTRQVAAAAVAALAILLIGAVVGAVVAMQQRNLARQQQRVAEEQREESRRRLVQLMVANGVQRLDEKDLSGSALWFAEAVDLEAGATGHDLQRLRLLSTLAQHPRLLQMWATGRPATGNTLKRWVAFGRGNRYAITNAVEGDLVLSGGSPSFELRPPIEPRLWDTHSGTRVKLKLPGDGLRLLAVDADANRVVIATAGAEGDVRTWNGTSGALLARMDHPCAVKDAQFSDDGRVLMTDCDDQVIRLWDSDRATLLASLQHAKPVSFAWITANRQRVLSGTTDDTAHVWTLGPQGRVVSHVELPHTDSLQEVNVGLDGRRVLTLANYTARLWEIRDDHRPVLLESLIAVNHIEPSPDGRIAVLATNYGRAVVWTLKTGAEVFSVAHDDNVVFEAVFSPDGSRFATASRDRSVRVWDADTGNLLAPPLYHEESVGHVDLSPERMWLVTITHNEIVRVWDLETGPKYPHESVNRAVFHPDGKHVMTVSDSEVKIWDVATWTSMSLSPGHQIYQASVSPDGQRIATASEDGLVRIWSATTGAELQSLRHGRRVRQAVFSPDGRKLASAGQAAGSHEVSIWDLATGAKSLVLPLGNSYLKQIEFSPDGSRLLTVGSEEAGLWDVARGHKIWELAESVDRATFDPSGTRLAMAQRTDALVLDAGTGRRLFPPIRPDNFGVTLLAFASGGRSLVIATQSGFVRVWDSEAGKPTTPPLGHGPAAIVRHVAVSADGRFLATAGSDGSARIWDIATGQPLTPPLSHPGGVVHAAFSPDGLRLVTIGNSAVRQWDLSRDPSRGSDVQLSRLARLLAARQIDSTGAVSALSRDEILGAWNSRAAR